MTPSIFPVPIGRPSFLGAPRCDDLDALDADVAIIAIPYNTGASERYAWDSCARYPSLSELRSYLDRLRASGARVSNYLVDLHLKLAFPLVNFIVVMIGAPVATRLRMQSAALGFGLSVAISFLYYGFMRAGQALGHNGALPPYLAAWLGDLVFGVVGFTMMVRAQRT